MAKATPKSPQKLSVAEARRARAERGICAYCDNPLGRGTYICDDHMAKRNTSTSKWNKSGRKRRYHARRTLGLCGRCGAEAIPGQSACGRCAELDVDSDGRKQARRIASGTCLKCSQAPVPGRRRCQRHLDLDRKKTQARRSPKPEKGRVLRMATPLAA